MKRLILCIGLLIAFHALWAQQTESIFKEASVIAPSPEATAMNQFIDLPVGHYTGIPNISVPIYTLQLPQMSLPISLNYHAGGLKVGEHSTWVGAGWSLNAGGSINRTVRGLPDEEIGSKTDGNCTTLTYGFLRLDQQYFDADMSGISEDSIRNTAYITGNNGQPIPKDPCALDLVDFFDGGYWDSEPDQYHFSFPGGSGKFNINRNRDVVKVTANDVKFQALAIDQLPDDNSTPYNLNATSFVLKDAAGIVYTFSATETTNTFSLCVGANPTGGISGGTPLTAHVSNWKLTKMSLKDNWIEFDYVTDSIVYDDHYSNRTAILAGPNNSSPDNYCTSKRSVTTKRLSKIRTSNGYEVEFIADDSRLDLEGGKRLLAVKVWKSDALLKHYRLDNNQYHGLNRKLKLTGVKQFSVSDSTVSLPGYSFEYHTGSGDFPAQDSYQQDYWGYFNGAPRNTTNMIPYMYLEGDRHVNPATHVSRAPSLAHTINGTISKLVYPTGGYTEFAYELNDFYDTAYRKIYTVGVDPPAANTSISTEEFDVSQSGDIEVITHGDVFGKHTWELERKSGTSTWTAVTLPLSGDHNLLSGTYRFTVTDTGIPSGPTPLGGGDSQQGSTDHITFRVVSKFTEVVDKRPSGGLRIRKMTFFDPLDSSTIYKHYLYEDENGLTSGRQFTRKWLPGYFRVYTPGTEIDGTCASFLSQKTTSMTVSHSSSTPAMTYQGSHVGYGSVYQFTYKPCPISPTEGFLGACGVSAASRFQFHNTWSAHDEPLIPQPDLTYKNGVKEKEEQFKYTVSSSPWRDNLTKLQEVTYHYEEITETAKAKGVLVKEESDSFCYQWNVGDPLRLDVLIVSYSIQPKWYRSTGQTTVQYDEDGENPTTTVSNVYYDSTATHYFPTSSAVTESTGAILTTEQTRDATNPALMIQQEVFRKESASSPVKQISGEQVTYHGVLPLSYSVWNRRHTSQEPINTNGYESAKIYTYGGGSLLKSSEDRPGTPSGARVAYLWSYDSSYVVAQITNITDQALEDLLPSTYSSFEDFAGETNHVDISSALQTIRANLTNINQMMTTYLFESPFGISKVIDPNGRESNYVYDDFGRLIRVKDHDGNVLSETEYNYSNQ